MKRGFLGYSKKKPADSRTVPKSTREESIDTLQVASIDSVNQKSIDNVHHQSIATRQTTVIDRANQPPKTLFIRTLFISVLFIPTLFISRQSTLFISRRSILFISRRSTLFISRRSTLFILRWSVLFIPTLFIRWKTTPLVWRQRRSKCSYLRSMRMGC